MGKKKGKKKEKQRKRGRESVGRASIYWLFRRNHRQKYSVGDSAGVSDTSLFGCPDLNPSVFPSVNSSEKNPRHPAVAIFKKNFSPTVFFLRLILIDFEMELFSSAMFTDENNFTVNSVGVIRFSGSDYRVSLVNKSLIYYIVYRLCACLVIDLTSSNK